MKVERDMLVAILLGIIVLIGALQALQLTGLKNGTGAGTSVATSAPAAAAAASPAASSPSAPAKQASVPSSLQNLPNMVGGC